jgi:predicted ABC-type transport system involved in lysophospholipase L1 biosynthesis ATPase subunit
MDLLLSLSGDGGRTVIVVTHDAEVAGRAERVLRMHDGRLSSPEVVVAAGQSFESS